MQRGDGLVGRSLLQAGDAPTLGPARRRHPLTQVAGSLARLRGCVGSQQGAQRLSESVAEGRETREPRRGCKEI
jgi:hypothetical protein